MPYRTIKERRDIGKPVDSVMLQLYIAQIGMITYRQSMDGRNKWQLPPVRPILERAMPAYLPSGGLSPHS